MRTTIARASLAALIGATVVGGAPYLAPAHATPAGAATACTTDRLPLTPGRAVRLAVALNGATATLRGTSGKAYAGVPRVLKARLTLTSAGRGTSFTPEPVAQTPGRGVLVDGFVAPASRTPALCLAQFSTGPVALLGVTSAFNQCCFLVDTYAPGVRARSPLQDGLVMPRLRVVNGRPAIFSADGSFLARFTDYADSAAPLRVLTVSGGRQRDVTVHYRRALRAEAHNFFATFNDRPSRGLGFLAAWAADQERLGHDSTVWSTLQQLDAAGKLDGMSGWPRSQSFINRLKSFLPAHGYGS